MKSTVAVELQKLEEGRGRSRRIAEATLPKFARVAKMSSTFDFLSSSYVFTTFSLCNSVLFCIFW